MATAMSLGFTYDDHPEQELAWLMRQERKLPADIQADDVRDLVLQLQTLVPAYLRELQALARELGRLVDLHSECELLRESRKDENTHAIETSLRGVSQLKKRVTEQVAVLERKEKEYAHVEAISVEQEEALRAISEVVDAMSQYHHSSAVSSDSNYNPRDYDPAVATVAIQQKEAAQAARNATLERLQNMADIRSTAVANKEKAVKHHREALRLYNGVHTKAMERWEEITSQTQTVFGRLEEVTDHLEELMEFNEELREFHSYLMECVKVHQDPRYLLPSITSDHPEYKKRQMFEIVKSLARQLNTETESFVLISAADGTKIDSSIPEETVAEASPGTATNEDMLKTANDTVERAQQLTLLGDEDGERPLPSLGEMDAQFESLMPSEDEMRQLEADAEQMLKLRNVDRLNADPFIDIEGYQEEGSVKSIVPKLEDLTLNVCGSNEGNMLQASPQESKEMILRRARAKRRRDYITALVQQRHDPQARLALREIKHPHQMARQRVRALYRRQRKILRNVRSRLTRNYSRAELARLLQALQAKECSDDGITTQLPSSRHDSMDHETLLQATTEACARDEHSDIFSLSAKEQASRILTVDDIVRIYPVNGIDFPPSELENSLEIDVLAHVYDSCNSSPRWYRKRGKFRNKEPYEERSGGEIERQKMRHSLESELLEMEGSKSEVRGEFGSPVHLGGEAVKASEPPTAITAMAVSTTAPKLLLPQVSPIKNRHQNAAGKWKGRSAGVVLQREPEP